MVSREKMFSWAICAYIICIMASPLKIISLLSEVFLLFAMICLKKKHTIKINLILKWAIAFFSVALVSSLFSEDIQAAMIGIRGFSEAVIFGYIIFTYYITEKDKLFNLFEFIIAGAIVSLILSILFVGVNNIMTARLTCEYYNGNSIGMNCAFAGCMVFFLFMQRKKMSFTKALVLEGILLIGIILSGSRKALFIFFIGFIYLVIVLAKNPMKKLRNVVIISFFTAIVAFVVYKSPQLYELIWVRAEKLVRYLLGSGEMDASTYERFLLSERGMEMIMEKPYLGHGINTFQSLSGFNMYSHNNYIEVAFGSGFIGLIVYYSIYLLGIIRSYIRIGIKSSFLLIGRLFLLILCVIEIGVVSYGNQFLYLILFVSLFLVDSKNVEQWE